MNGVKMSDCRFYINEEKRTVVCVIPNTRDMVFDFIVDHFYDGHITFFYGKKTDSLMMPNSFTGKAVCAQEDEWDEETGKLIAFYRAKNKCYKSFFKRVDTFIWDIDTALDNFAEIVNDFGDKLTEKAEKLEEEITNRTAQEEE